MRHIINLIAPLLLLCACEGDIIPGAEQQIVVEGWIDDGGFPVVVLTKTLPMRNGWTYMTDLSEYMVKWAKVVVSDGTESVVLTGKYNASFFPPYIYESSQLRGEAGKTYRLTVDVDGYHTEATTTIPQRAFADSITFRRSDMIDTLYTITAHVPQQQNKYFNLFVQDYGNDGYFLSSFLGAFTGDDLPPVGSKAIEVKRGRKYTDFTTDYKPYFSSGDTLLVKLAAMDDFGYSFWSSYERMVSLSRNLFFPYNKSLPTNLTSGRGYWIGYGSTIYPVVLP